MRKTFIFCFLLPVYACTGTGAKGGYSADSEQFQAAFANFDGPFAFSCEGQYDLAAGDHSEALTGDFAFTVTLDPDKGSDVLLSGTKNGVTSEKRIYDRITNEGKMVYTYENGEAVNKYLAHSGTGSSGVYLALLHTYSLLDYEFIDGKYVAEAPAVPYLAVMSDVSGLPDAFHIEISFDSKARLYSIQTVGEEAILPGDTKATVKSYQSRFSFRYSGIKLADFDETDFQ